MPPAPSTPPVEPDPPLRLEGRPAADEGFARRPWFNDVPSWIYTHPDFRNLRTMPAAQCHVFMTINHRCDARTVGGHGSKIGCIGGAPFDLECRCTPKTRRGHIAALIRMGFVVPINKGGKLAGERVANVYGVPGRQGDLDCLRHDGKDAKARRWDEGEARKAYDRTVGRNSLVSSPLLRESSDESGEVLPTGAQARAVAEKEPLVSGADIDLVIPMARKLVRA